MIGEGATWRSARGEFLDLGVSVSAHCPSQRAIPPPAHRGQVLERKSCGRSAILGKKLQFLVQTPLSKNSCLIAAQLRQKAFSSESFSHYWVEKCPVGQGGWRMWDWNSRWMVLKVKSPLLTLYCAFLRVRLKTASGENLSPGFHLLKFKGAIW